MNIQNQSASLAEQLGMTTHPEGGWYIETYRSPGTIPQSALPGAFNGPRSYSTAILYLLAEGQKSHLHRLYQDEVWHFHLGGPLRLVIIHPDGKAEECLLSREIEKGHKLQKVVPGGSWFGASPCPGSGYSLLGCTVSPGFDFADFEMADGSELKKSFPAHYGLIREYARNG